MTVQIRRDQLIALLDLPDADYWADVACCQARKLIDEGGDVLLSNLATTWRDWPWQRQEHLAYILGEGFSAIEAHILREMAKSEDSNIAFRAREGLRGLEMLTSAQVEQFGASDEPATPAFR